MRCGEFLKNHVAYVDDLLAGAEMEAMDRHRAACASCARRDAAVRRSLMLVRNLPVVHPSPDFYKRLELRIREGAMLEDRRPSRAYVPSIGNFAALAAGLAAVGYVAVQAARGAMHSAAAPSPAVASVTALPDAATLSFQTPALATVVPTEFPVWPDALGPDDAASFRTTHSPLVQTSLTH
jgi:anti-sigma factor RsiW